MNKFTMSETPKFIALIKQCECLWKKSFRHDAESRKQAWEEIADKMYGCNWKTFTAADKMTAKNELRKKWKNIKDSFIKELRYQHYEQSGRTSKRKSKYTFFDALLFLKPEVDIKSRIRFKQFGDDIETYSNGLDTEDMLKEDNNSSETGHYENICKSPSSVHPQEETRAVVRTSTPVMRRTVKKQPKMTSVHFRTRLLKILSQQKNEKQNCPHDDDESFFHSLLPIVRKLDEQQKIQFRMEVLNSLRNVRNYANSNQATLNLGNMANSQPYFPVTQHQLQIYSLPSTHTELPASTNHPQHNSNIVSVSNASQLHHVSIANELGCRKNEDVQVFSNVL